MLVPVVPSMLCLFGMRAWTPLRQSFSSLLDEMFELPLQDEKSYFLDLTGVFSRCLQPLVALLCLDIGLSKFLSQTVLERRLIW